MRLFFALLFFFFLLGRQLIEYIKYKSNFMEASLSLSLSRGQARPKYYYSFSYDVCSTNKRIGSSVFAFFLSLCAILVIINNSCTKG